MLITPLFPEGKIKALTFSYDDGSVYDQRLIEIFNRYGMKGTFNLNAGRADLKNLNTIYAGHEIACHGKIHCHLERILPCSSLENVLEDRRLLEKHTGKIVRGMAYPMGTYTRRTMEMLRAAGIVYARTCKATNGFLIPEDFLEWHPTCHHSANGNLNQIAERFLNWSYPLSLCYIWGHAHEFHYNNNWQDMENFCEKLAGKTDIWYATNIEIYNYITAVHRLETSADTTIIRNPSVLPVWFSTENGNVREILPDETLKLE